MNISKIKTQSDKQVIDSASGIISDIKEPFEKGGKYPEVSQSAKLTEGQDWLFIEVVGTDLREFEGKWITFTSSETQYGLRGVAVKKTEKNGKTYTNLRVTAAANIKVTEGGESAPEPSQPAQGGQDTPKPSNAPQRPALPQTEGVLGMTVGMAINNAVKLIGQDDCSMDYLKSLQFSKDVHTIASDLIRVSKALEKGNLADHPKDREANQQPPEPVQPAPAPEPTTPEIEEDPF